MSQQKQPALFVDAGETKGNVMSCGKVRRYHWSDGHKKVHAATNGDLFLQPTKNEVEYFGSGATAIWDMRGYIVGNKPFGITATQMPMRAEQTPEKIRAVRSYVERGGRVFIDSGAFGAHKSKQVLDFGVKVFPVYKALSDGIKNPGGLMMVMPDVIGKMDKTRGLLEEFKAEIFELMDIGVECIFAIQDAKSDTLAEFNRLKKWLDGRAFTVGVPSNEHAWNAQQTIEFAAAAKPKRMHLLGLGQEESVSMLRMEIAAVSPETALSCDSCTLVANLGVGRRLTDRCHGRVDAAVEFLANGGWLEEEGIDIPDLSTYVQSVWYDERFVPEEIARKMPEAFGLSKEQWEEKFAEASGGAMADVLGQVDPDEEWLYESLNEFVKSEMYVPMVRNLITGPIRAWEVARLACGDDAALENVKRKGETLCHQ